MCRKLFALAAAAASIVIVALTASAGAATRFTAPAGAASAGAATAADAATLVVTPRNAVRLGWVAENIGGGTETFTDSFGAPAGLGAGALELSTTAADADQAYFRDYAVAGMPLAAVSNLSYWNYTPVPDTVDGASLKLAIWTGELCPDLTPDLTTLTYEPYWNVSTASDGAAIAGRVPSGWTEWSITPTSGVFWSFDTTCNGALQAGHGGPPFYTLSQVLADYPDARLVSVGVDVGTYNPSYDVAVDGVTIDNVTYNFEPVRGDGFLAAATRH